MLGATTHKHWESRFIYNPWFKKTWQQNSTKDGGCLVAMKYISANIKRRIETPNVQWNHEKQRFWPPRTQVIYQKNTLKHVGFGGPMVYIYISFNLFVLLVFLEVSRFQVNHWLKILFFPGKLPLSHTPPPRSWTPEKWWERKED